VERKRAFQYLLFALLLGLLYLSFLLIKPFLTAIILAVVVAYFFHPIYKAIRFIVRWRALASILTILLVLALVIVPAIFIGTSLASQAKAEYELLAGMNIPERLNETVSSLGIDTALANVGLSVSNVMDSAVQAGRDYFVISTPDLLTKTTGIVIGFFVFFFLLFFAFKDGESWVAAAKEATPLEPEHKERLFERIQSVTRGVLYGQFLSAVIQGLAGGLMFYFFGIPNAVLWGVIMVVLSFIPMAGTPFVWAPIAIIELLRGHYVPGIGILVVGTIVVMNVDNVLRPRLIGKHAHLSTPMVMLGVIGGLLLFGLTGLILGPLILALLQTTLLFYQEHGDAIDEKNGERRKLEKKGGDKRNDEKDDSEPEEKKENWKKNIISSRS